MTVDNYVDEVSDTIADSVSTLDEAKEVLRNWIDTAAYHCRNEFYYRELVQAIGKTIGREAYIADDGGEHTDVLCAKVPELVVEMKKKCTDAFLLLEQQRQQYADKCLELIVMNEQYAEAARTLSLQTRGFVPR